jgi:hypothetical protein
MVMPYVSGGSVLNIMKYAYPEARCCPFLASFLRACCSLLLITAPAGHMPVPPQMNHVAGCAGTG